MVNMMSHFDTVLLSMDEILIIPNQQLSAMLGADCYWEVMGSRLDGTHKKRCEMSNGWLMHIPCFSTTMTWPCLKYMAHFPSPTFSRAYDNQYVLYCCNISQGGQGWCFSPDDSGINPIQRTICGWCSPNAAVIATESPAVNVAPATPCCRGFCRGRPVVPQRYLRGSALRKVCAMWAALSCLAGIIPQLCGGHTTHIYFHTVYVSTNLRYSVILYKYIWKACVSIYMCVCVFVSAHVHTEINDDQCWSSRVRSLARVGGYEVFDHSYDAVVIGAGGAGTATSGDHGTWTYQPHIRPTCKGKGDIPDIPPISMALDGLTCFNHQQKPYLQRNGTWNGHRWWRWCDSISNEYQRMDG